MNRLFFINQFHRFGYALLGLKYLIKYESNIRIHLIISLLVIVSGYIAALPLIEWLFIISCIAAVISLEIINSVVEMLCDFIHIERHPVIGKIKDLSAAAVLFTSITSAIIGLMIFIPKLISI